MNTGQVDIQNRTYDLGLHLETDSTLVINSNSVSWTHRKENGDLVKYIKNIADPREGLLGDYLVSSGVREVPEPFAIGGYYPLYMTSHVASAAGGGTGAHEHNLNGKTYYMPNGGTIYHGDYSPADTYEELGGYLCVTKQDTKTKPCVGKLLANITDLTQFTTKSFYDANGV